VQKVGSLPLLKCNVVREGLLDSQITLVGFSYFIATVLSGVDRRKLMGRSTQRIQDADTVMSRKTMYI